MKRILITGMSGTGKSTVIEALLSKGYRAIDFDTPNWSEYVPYRPPTELDEKNGPEKEWVWQTVKVERLLEEDKSELLFVSGTASNMGQFYKHFDYVVLLSAPTPLLTERIATRKNNNFGKHPEELNRILKDIETIEPLLRRGASHEIVTDKPLDDVVRQVLTIAEGKVESTAQKTIKKEDSHENL